MYYFSSWRLKGIPGKNIYPINNHPLISYTLAAAFGSKYISEVIVSTDDIKISREAQNYGAKVPFLRPKKLARDKTLSVDALRFTVLEYEKFTGKNLIMLLNYHVFHHLEIQMI